MAIDDKRDVNETSLDRRLTLVRGGSHEATPHRAPELKLIANPDRELLVAVTQNDPRRVSAWLARGADPNARDPDGRTALYEAVLRWKDTAIAELLLDRGADLRVRDKDGQTPLHAAAMFGGGAQLRLFLDRGAEIDARDARAQTPLHCAAALGRVEAVTFLVSRGADVCVRDQGGRTPLARVWSNYDRGLLGPEGCQLLERMLAGFMTARVVEARPDSLIVQAETLHTKYPEAMRQATERGTLAIPCGLLREVPEPGGILRCPKGLSQGLDEAWRQARCRELGIEPER